MSFIVLPVTTGHPFTGFSTPDMISFTCDDTDGSGGAILVNGTGENGSVFSNTFVDMQTLFGSAFRSHPLLGVFSRVPAVNDNATALQLLVQNVQITMEQFGAIPPAVLPLVSYLGTIPGPPDRIGPFLVITSPNVASAWWVNISLRHSLVY